MPPGPGTQNRRRSSHVHSPTRATARSRSAQGAVAPVRAVRNSGLGRSPPVVTALARSAQSPVTGPEGRCLGLGPASGDESTRCRHTYLARVMLGGFGGAVVLLFLFLGGKAYASTVPVGTDTSASAADVASLFQPTAVMGEPPPAVGTTLPNPAPITPVAAVDTLVAPAITEDVAPANALVPAVQEILGTSRAPTANASDVPQVMSTRLPTTSGDAPTAAEPPSPGPVSTGPAHRRASAESPQIAPRRPGGPIRSPVRPAVPLLLAIPAIESGGFAPSHANGASGSLLPKSTLLPSLKVSGLVLGQTRGNRWLFDTRGPPPG